MTSSKDSRRHERETLFLVADLRLQRDGAPVAVKLRNISDSGVMAEGPMRVSPGRKIWIELRNIGIVAGTVAWAAGDRCGIAFEEAIDSGKVRFPVKDVDLPEDADRPYELRNVKS